jgi:hypothetical protein
MILSIFALDLTKKSILNVYLGLSEVAAFAVKALIVGTAHIAAAETVAKTFFNVCFIFPYPLLNY